MPKLADILDEKVFVDVGTAAELHLCSVKSILRRAETYGMKTIVINRKFFFLAKDFKKFMEDNPIVSKTPRSR
ncbi:MAG: hypothetical protein ACREJN_21230 [Nitrospiraceae bacterium]